MGVNITTIDYLRILIIEIGSTIILMVTSESCVYSNLETPGRAKRASSNVAKRMPGVEHIAGGTEFGEDTV